jgi:uncharacterized protein (DUF1501 family)
VTDKDYLRAQRELWEPATGPNGMSRRKFLQALGIGTGAALAAPTILSRFEAFAADSSPTDGILVLVMLDGGNDGLNTLVPFNDAKYRALRPTLKYGAPGSGARATLNINDANFGLNPNLPKLAARYLQNKVAFVRGVGYNPSDMSHFTSMGYWMNGWKDAPPQQYANGWVGRYMDSLPGAGTNALLGACIGSSVPLHMIGSTARAAGIPQDISGAFGINRSKPYDARMFDAFASYGNASTGKGQWADMIGKTAKSSMTVAQTVQPAYAGDLGDDDLVQQLTLTARLINLNLGTRVFHTKLGSFDTHGDQESMHTRLLTSLDAGIEAFFANLSAAQKPRVTLVTFSEFGRRPDEASNGTDHGAAGLDIIVGDKVKGGLYGEQPSLTNLDANGNLKASTDFRAVYAEMLGSWLGADPVPILGKDYPRLGLFTGSPVTPTTSSTLPPIITTTTTQPPATTTTTTTKPPATTTTTKPPATTTTTQPPPATQPTAGTTTTTKPPATTTTKPPATTTTTQPTTTTGTLPRLRRRRRWRGRRFR